MMSIFHRRTKVLAGELGASSIIGQYEKYAKKRKRLLTSRDNSYIFISQNVAAIYTVLAQTSFGSSLDKEHLLFATGLCDMYSYMVSGELDPLLIEDAAMSAYIGELHLQLSNRTLYDLLDYTEYKELKSLAMNLVALAIWAEAKKGRFGRSVGVDNILDAVLLQKAVIEDAVSTCLKHPEEMDIYQTVKQNVSAWADDSDFQRLVLALDNSSGLEVYEEDIKPSTLDIIVTSASQTACAYSVLNAHPFGCSFTDDLDIAFTIVYSLLNVPDDESKEYLISISSLAALNTSLGVFGLSDTTRLVFDTAEQYDATMFVLALSMNIIAWKFELLQEDEGCVSEEAVIDQVLMHQQMIKNICTTVLSYPKSTSCYSFVSEKISQTLDSQELLDLLIELHPRSERR